MLRPAAAVAGPPAPLPQVAVPPPLVTPIVQPQFQPPLLPLNSPAGASPSLRSLFPDIEPACITAVITHDLKASDLYKLDTRVKDSEPTYSLSATGTFEMNNSKHKTYKNFNSVAFPLHAYFAILTAHLPDRSAATIYFYRYLTHIATLATEYEWPAVFEYHTLFFNRRRNDMLAGEYDGWGSSDIGLLSSHVYPHRKAISITPAKAASKRPATAVGTEPCRNYNLGKCTSPCSYGRPHVCSAPACGKEHPLTQHPK
ncbi:hypothetical protein B0H16DRAFT_1322458 [Mycena metata]|uniref:Uncharacterized protein n=1 Tax=Mycena metata TaxID=1033252 RepID=A0AAD7IIB7_9AGAR|nr:hypothetical protein B0H16DRAFT_1322458 [Mycena metata]